MLYQVNLQAQNRTPTPMVVVLGILQTLVIRVRLQQRIVLSIRRRFFTTTLRRQRRYPRVCLERSKWLAARHGWGIVGGIKQYIESNRERLRSADAIHSVARRYAIAIHRPPCPYPSLTPCTPPSQCPRLPPPARFHPLRPYPNILCRYPLQP